MSRVLVIGCGGVASVAIKKCCQVSDVFTEPVSYTHLDGTLTVFAKPIIVTIQNATSVYGNDIAELKATDNGIVNGDKEVYSLARCV